METISFAKFPIVLLHNRHHTVKVPHDELLADARLPMLGYALGEELRRDSTTQTAPILIVTTEISLTELERARAARCGLERDSIVIALSSTSFSEMSATEDLIRRLRAVMSRRPSVPVRHVERRRRVEC
jgi:CheY-like chemotaxis protein